MQLKIFMLQFGLSQVLCAAQKSGASISGPSFSIHILANSLWAPGPVSLQTAFVYSHSHRGVRQGNMPFGCGPSIMLHPPSHTPDLSKYNFQTLSMSPQWQLIPIKESHTQSRMEAKPFNPGVVPKGGLGRLLEKPCTSSAHGQYCQ